MSILWYLALQSLWNPFRDWNQTTPSAFPFRGTGFKASETLLGIETIVFEFDRRDSPDHGFKASETLLGIETR